jgi:hypothetical protein
MSRNEIEETGAQAMNILSKQCILNEDNVLNKEVGACFMKADHNEIITL